MNQETLHIITALLLIISFVLIVWGLGTAKWIWLLGLACAATAHVVALLIHWAPQQEEVEDNNSSQSSSPDQ